MYKCIKNDKKAHIFDLFHRPAGLPHRPNLLGQHSLSPQCTMRKQRILRLRIWIHRQLQHPCQADEHFAHHCRAYCRSNLALLHNSHRVRQVHRVRVHNLPKQLATRSHAHPLGLKRPEHAVHFRQRAHLASADHSAQRMLSCHNALHPVWGPAERTGGDADSGHH